MAATVSAGVMLGNVIYRVSRLPGSGKKGPVRVIANDTWFNDHNLNCRLCQLGVSVKVAVLWNMGGYGTLLK